MSLPELIPSNLPVFTRKTPRSNFANSVVPQGSALLFAQSDSNGGVRFVTKNSDGSYTDVGGGGQQVTAGYFAKDGDNLKFYATESSSGELVEQIMIADTGKDQPEYQGGGSGTSMNFYRCSSADTSNSTWSGHKATINAVTDEWSFQDTSTSGLSYTKLIPVVGRVYDQKGSFVVSEFKVTIPQRGLVFYAPLQSSNKAVLISNKQVQQTGDISYQVYNGIPCGFFGGGSDIHQITPDSSLPTGYADRTVSGWMYAQDATWSWIFGYGDQGPEHNGGQILGISTEGYPVYSQQPDIKDQSIYAIYKWLHVCGVVRNNKRQLYVNGVLKGSGNMTAATSNICGAYIGSSCGVQYFYGYISSIRVYNRALTEMQIAALASQFTPVQE